MSEQDPSGQPESERWPDDESPEGLRITEGIADALLNDQTIDDVTAMLIAFNISSGSGALQQLALTGEIAEGIEIDFAVAAEVMSGDDQGLAWRAALIDYCCSRDAKGPVAGWPGQDWNRSDNDN